MNPQNIYTDDEWEEVSQDLPKEADPFIQKYLQGREALIAEENKERSDASFKKNLSPIAKRACAIAARIREEEKNTVWTPQLEDALAREADIVVHPGMMFSLSKARMERTKLWRIVRRMPKGALLHAHMDAMVDFDFLFRVLLATPGIHLAADRPLTTDEEREDAKLTFRFFRQPRTEGNLWSPDYKPDTFVLLTQAADAFPDGGKDGFLKWLYGRCTISRTDAVSQHHGVDHIWQKFAKCFRVVGSMIHYEPIFRQFLRRLMTLLKADGINWCELRFSWALDYYRQDSETPESDYGAMMTVIDEEVARFKETPEGEGFWGLRIIWAALRFFPTRGIVENMEQCIETKITHPHLIAGYDLVGQEDSGRPLRDLLPELFWFRKQCAQEGVNIPFFFHAGECLGSGNSTDHNLFDAILLGTRRIGHGFSLYKHPLLINLVKEKKILVESCPISNEVLRLCGSVMSHPLPALLARGVACSLCNDDPAMLGQDTAGSTHDFWQALQGWENLGLAGLGSLAENSIRWAAFEDQSAEEWSRGIREASTGSGTKAQRLKEWEIEWEKFCVWVVDEFGED
ncbi:Metallo-dependent hydrolase [Daldinia caldariorum]|uniref:Metallo-dependent hydrolase n=1 Tax=Daldinia caldariorum TaxID=326644 RepID=UPI0020088C8D|nr:Metallo-dependent hydrolase [Daldinia caldariorum]KAI1465995.1 Metallo-dependent hydrolase [Daldinia caldariorum]